MTSLLLRFEIMHKLQDGIMSYPRTASASEREQSAD